MGGSVMMEGRLALAGRCRLTLLSDRLLRVETSGRDAFEDRPTQTAALRPEGREPRAAIARGLAVEVETGAVSFLFSRLLGRVTEVRLAARSGGAVLDDSRSLARSRDQGEYRRRLLMARLPATVKDAFLEGLGSRGKA